MRSVQDLDWEMSKRTLLCRRPDAENVNSVVHVVGGRQSYLNKVSRAEEMLQAAEDLLRSEKAWLENCLGLIPDCDNDGEVVVQVCLAIMIVAELLKINLYSKNGACTAGLYSESSYVYTESTRGNRGTLGIL